IEHFLNYINIIFIFFPRYLKYSRGNSGLLKLPQWIKIIKINLDDFVKTQIWDGKVKSFRCKARKS
ncbi:MAG: hypothetical protein COX20_11100, partial [Desulfobacterales bacterium CG23_combo_of_CG06-09_8_20_14_all_52_9]